MDRQEIFARGLCVVIAALCLIVVSFAILLYNPAV